MKRSYPDIISPATLTVYVGVVVALGAATLISPAVYGSWWFIALWSLFAVTLAVSIVFARMWRNGGSFLLHLSLLAILAGGLATWLTRERGTIYLQPGETVDVFMSDSGELIPLPESICLEKFEVIYYPGGVVPMDYESHIMVDGAIRVISMNNIFDLEGYRLLQASYDGEGGSVLSVSYDPYGMPLSYAGYAMFAVGGVWILLARGGGFRRMMRSLAVPALIVACAPCSSAGNTPGLKTAGVPKEAADSLSGNQVVYNGRIVTFNTLARDVVTKLHGKPEYRGLTPEQTILSYRLFPEIWKDQPLIRVKERSICRALGIEGDHIALSDLFDSVGNYRVSPLYHTLGENGRRGVEELDEKAGILLTLLSGELIVEPSAEVSHLPPWRVSLELIYNRIPIGKIIFILLLAGFSLSALSLVATGRWSFILGKSGMILLPCALVSSVANFVLQWILASHLPLSNTYETLEFVVMAMEMILIFFLWRNRVLFPLGMLFAGTLALVAHLVEVNPVVTPLMPVLHSPWLSLHVSLIMTSYAILSFTFIIALAALARPSQSDYLRRLSSVLLYPGVWLLGSGIFTGAVWANVSWGQYWSWDPKETWALITMMVYALPLHGGFLRILRNPRSFHIYLLLAILSIAMTYFGVNYMDSMHAYN